MSRRWTPAPTNWVATSEHKYTGYVRDEWEWGWPCPRRRRYAQSWTMIYELDPEIGSERFAINGAVTERKYGTWREPYEDAEAGHNNALEWDSAAKARGSNDSSYEREDPEYRSSLTDKKTDELHEPAKRGCLIQ